MGPGEPFGVGGGDSSGIADTAISMMECKFITDMAPSLESRILKRHLQNFFKTYIFYTLSLKCLMSWTPSTVFFLVPPC